MQELVFWGLVFGPLTFPLALVCWHCVQVARGEQRYTQGDNVARWVQISWSSGPVLSSFYISKLSTYLHISEHIYTLVASWDHTSLFSLLLHI